MQNLVTLAGLNSGTDGLRAISEKLQQAPDSYVAHRGLIQSYAVAQKQGLQWAVALFGSVALCYLQDAAPRIPSVAWRLVDGAPAAGDDNPDVFGLYIDDELVVTLVAAANSDEADLSGHRVHLDIRVTPSALDTLERHAKIGKYVPDDQHLPEQLNAGALGADN